MAELFPTSSLWLQLAGGRAEQAERDLIPSGTWSAQESPAASPALGWSSVLGMTTVPGGNVQVTYFPSLHSAVAVTSN